MDYANEEWIKVYVRDTARWRATSLYARGLALELSRNMGRFTDTISLGPRGLRAVASLVSSTWEEVEPLLRELIEDGHLVYDEQRQLLIDPEHLPRQRSVTSPAQRKRDSRRAGSNVTRGHAMSRAVTFGHDQREEIEEREQREESARACATPTPGSEEAHEPEPEPEPEELELTDEPPMPPEESTEQLVAATARDGAWPRPYHVRRAEQAFYTAAFSEGAREATGRPYAIPREELAALDDAVDTYLPEDLRAPMRSTDREVWVRSRSADYRRAVAGMERFWTGGGPRGFLRWLGAGGPDADELRLSPDELEQRRREAARKARERTREAETRKRQRAEELEAQQVDLRAGVASLARAVGVPTVSAAAASGGTS